MPPPPCFIMCIELSCWCVVLHQTFLLQYYDQKVQASSHQTIIIFPDSFGETGCMFLWNLADGWWCGGLCLATLSHSSDICNSFNAPVCFSTVVLTNSIFVFSSVFRVVLFLVRSLTNTFHLHDYCNIVLTSLSTEDLIPGILLLASSWVISWSDEMLVVIGKLFVVHGSSVKCNQDDIRHKELGVTTELY